jgi:hypothetical protein
MKKDTPAKVYKSDDFSGSISYTELSIGLSIVD